MIESKHTWGSDPRRGPKIEEGETEIYSEHGRDLLSADKQTGVCYCSHWFKVVKDKHGSFYWLLVEHGGGFERVKLGFKRMVYESWAKLSSDERYLLMWQILAVYHDGRDEARAKENERWHTAFVEGRAKKRKMPGARCIQSVD